MRFFLTRLLRAAVTLAVIVTFAFFVLRLSGDPAITILGTETDAAALEAFRTAWGLDRPLWVQYATYVQALLQGDFGQSMRLDQGAMQLVAERALATFTLTVPALAITLAVGVPAGVFAALHRGSAVDRTVMIVAVVGFTVPSFIMALVLILVFAVELRLLPSTGYGTWQHAILPVVTLALGGTAAIARFTRSAMVEVLGQPYIPAASAKGLIWPIVVRRHALPNAAIPVVTVVGFMIGSLAAGTVIVESIFSWPGAGRLLIDSVANRDYAVVQTILLLVGLMMVLANLTVDLLYGWLDPRIRTERAS